MPGDALRFEFAELRSEPARIPDQFRLNLPKSCLIETGIERNIEDGQHCKGLIKRLNDYTTICCDKTENPSVGGSIPPLATKIKSII
jgi:hypothetical protein